MNKVRLMMIKAMGIVVLVSRRQMRNKPNKHHQMMMMNAMVMIMQVEMKKCRKKFGMSLKKMIGMILILS